MVRQKMVQWVIKETFSLKVFLTVENYVQLDFGPFLHRPSQQLLPLLVDNSFTTSTFSL